MQLTTPPLDEFVELPELHPQVQEIFRTKDSLKWFVRRHRSALAESQALIIIAGRMRFHPVRFKEAAVAIGVRQAAS